MSKVLFLVKKNHDYGSQQTSKAGLINSVKYLAEALEKHLHISAAIEVCVDANEIDKYIHLHRPKFCIIEAIWVTPTKINELCDKWAGVDFVVRIHSRIPFLANEGVAVSWIKKYVDINKNLFIAFNNQETFEDFTSIGVPCLYMPNIYDIEKNHDSRFSAIIDDVLVVKEKRFALNVGCFGAIRPLKNQLLQAVAAMRFCDKHNKRLFFHINHSRVEQKGDNVLKNLRALFCGTSHVLCEVGWLSHHHFKELISTMDIGMQVSLSESFNIVTADFVDCGVPIVVSEDIDWVSKKCVADVGSTASIVDRMEYVLKHKHKIVRENRIELDNHNCRALLNYLFLKGHTHC